MDGWVVPVEVDLDFTSLLTGFGPAGLAKLLSGMAFEVDTGFITGSAVSVST